jgi:hypothetical protein
MLDSLSIGQKTAFEALGLGPVWMNRLVPVEGNAQEQIVPLGMVFRVAADSRSASEDELLKQILKAAKLPFEQAQSTSVGSLKAGACFEVLLSFDTDRDIESLIEKQTIRVTKMIVLPSLAAIASEGKSKAFAWKALKKFLLDSR